MRSMALPGNQHALKLKTPELRQAAYKQYCDHLSLGKSKESWYFEHPELSITAKGLERYLKDTDEFPPIKKEIAEAKGFAKWEQVLEDSATGKDHGKTNTTSLLTILRNKYGFDRDKDPHHEKKQETEQAMGKLMTHLDSVNSSKSNISNE